jgi:hypothetical protein
MHKPARVVARPRHCNLVGVVSSRVSHCSNDAPCKGTVSHLPPSVLSDVVLTAIGPRPLRFLGSSQVSPCRARVSLEA